MLSGWQRCRCDLIAPSALFNLTAEGRHEAISDSHRSYMSPLGHPRPTTLGHKCLVRLIANASDTARWANAMMTNECEWQIEQGKRCGCRGTDEWCGCQNVRNDEPNLIGRFRGTRDQLCNALREVERRGGMIGAICGAAANELMPSPPQTGSPSEEERSDDEVSAPADQLPDTKNQSHP